MVRELALSPLLGMPLVAWGGIFTMISMLLTATIAVLNHKGIHLIPFKWHPRLAIATITIGIIHGFFGLSLFLNF